MAEAAVVQRAPRKNYRLYDGRLGTEYEACQECIERLEAQRRHLDERIELLRLRMQIAEGAP